MLRREGEVFLLGTAMSAPIPYSQNELRRASPLVTDSRQAVEPLAGLVARGVAYSDFVRRCNYCLTVLQVAA